MICNKLKSLVLILLCTISFCIILANGAQAEDDNTGSIWENFNTFESYMLQNPPTCLNPGCGGSTLNYGSNPTYWRVKFKCTKCSCVTTGEGIEEYRRIEWYYNCYM